MRSVRQSRESASAERNKLPWWISSFFSNNSSSAKASACGAGESGQDLAVMKAVDFAGGAFDLHIAHCDLAVAAHRDFAVAAGAQNRGAAKSRSVGCGRH